MLTGSLPAQSNRATWTLLAEITDADTGEPLDLTGCTVVIEARDTVCRQPVICATTGNGKVTIIDTGMIQAVIPVDEMKRVCPGTYNIGGTVERDGDVQQFLIGVLPVIDGVVSR